MTDELQPIPFDGEHSEDDLNLFGDYRRLLPIIIEGNVCYVPEDNSVLRCLQYLELREGCVRMDWGSYCWNDTKGCCEMRYREDASSSAKTGRACITQVEANMVIERLPTGGKWRGGSSG